MDSRFALRAGKVSFGEPVTLRVTHPVYGLTSYKYRFECFLAGDGGMKQWSLGSDLRLESEGDTEDIYTWTPPAAYAVVCPDALSVNGTLSLIVDSYINGAPAQYNLAVNTYDLTIFVPDSMKPEVELAVTPVNDNAKLAEWNIFAKGMSRARYSIEAEALYGASIEKHEFSFAGQSLEGASGTTDVLSGSGAPTATVTDSRGKVATLVQPVTLYEYGPPVLRSTVSYRCDANKNLNESGSCLRVECSAVCSSLGGRNMVSVRARYRAVGGEWGGYIALEHGVDTQIAVNLPADTVYEVELSAVDLVGSVTAVSFTGDNGRVAMHMRDGGDGVAFGKECTKAGFACAWDAEFDGNVNVGGQLTVGKKTLVDLIYPVGSIYLSTTAVNPATLFGGTWAQIKDTFLLSAGSKYSLGNTGGAAEVTLTANQMPKHTHRVTGDTDTTPLQHTHNLDTASKVDSSFGNGPVIEDWGGYNTSYGSRNVTTGIVAGSTSFYDALNHSHEFDVTSNSAGGGAAHNNMPPYLVVSVWKRTA